MFAFSENRLHFVLKERNLVINPAIQILEPTGHTAYNVQGRYSQAQKATEPVFPTESNAICRQISIVLPE